ncbi:hypothetical protein [Spongiactinospora sp. 9N601]
MRVGQQDHQLVGQPLGLHPQEHHLRRLLAFVDDLVPDEDALVPAAQ